MIPEAEAIKNAATLSDASDIRNRVAAAANRGERPMADWEAILDAFYRHWGDRVIESHREAARSEVRIYGS